LPNTWEAPIIAFSPHLATAMDHSLLVLCALLVNAAFGGPKAWYAAAGLTRFSVMPARALRDLERKLNREHRSAEDRRMRGWALLVCAVFSSLAIGSVGGWIFRDNARFIEIVLVAILLPVRPIWDRAAAIRAALVTIDIPAARQALTGTPWRHHALLDEFGLARAAIETTVVDFSEKIITPVLGYLLFGLPGLFICRSVTLLRDALAHAPDFGKGALLAHTVLHALPARLSALFWISGAAFLPQTNIPAALKRLSGAFINDRPRALCIKTAAAAGRLSLGGPTSPYLSTWAENGTAKASATDIRRGQTIYLFALIFLFVVTGAFF
jgi:cobalamin biosynthesis protein CobD/CbiB